VADGFPLARFEFGLPCCDRRRVRVIQLDLQGGDLSRPFTCCLGFTYRSTVKAFADLANLLGDLTEAADLPP
jgi:hypothetical protein